MKAGERGEFFSFELHRYANYVVVYVEIQKHTSSVTIIIIFGFFVFFFL